MPSIRRRPGNLAPLHDRLINIAILLRNLLTVRKSGSIDVYPNGLLQHKVKHAA